MGLKIGRLKRIDGECYVVHQQSGEKFGPVRGGDTLTCDGGSEEWDVESVCGTLQLKRLERDRGWRHYRRLRPIAVLVGEIVELRP